MAQALLMRLGQDATLAVQKEDDHPTRCLLPLVSGVQNYLDPLPQNRCA